MNIAQSILHEKICTLCGNEQC